MTKNKKIIIWSIVCFVLLTLFVLGTIFDLQISKALASLTSNQYLSLNTFAIIGEIFGENILYILLMCALSIIALKVVKSPYKKKWINYLILVFSLLVSLLIGMYLLNNTLNSVLDYTDINLEDYSIIRVFLILIISGIINFLIFILFNKLSVKNINNLFWWAVLVIIVGAVSNLAVQILKHIFDRTRFRAMVFVEDLEYTFYSPWYKINKLKFDSVSPFAEDFFKSFPSGHTCAAASIFTLVTLPLFIKKFDNRKSKIILWTISISYTILVALSRIIAGAHFFTDVFVAGIITFICVIATTLIFQKIKLIKTEEKFESKTTINQKKGTKN